MAWLLKCNIKQFLGDDPTSADDLVGVAKNIRTELEKVHIGDHGLVKAMEKAAEKGVDYDDAEAIFNKRLSLVYDEADVKRVWLGP